MGLTKLIATKKLRYRTRALAAGEPFEASDRDAWILVHARKRAKLASDVPATPTPTPVPAPKPAPAPPPPPQPAAPEDPGLLERLRTTALRLGITVDNRWGAARLQSEIAAKRQELRGPV